MSFGQNLQLFRKNAGITQEELAERLEVSRQSVSKWESDASFPEMEKIIALCDMFGCSMDTLVKGDAAKEICEDTAGYDKHMNRFAKMMSAGVGIVISGTAISGFLDEMYSSDSITGMVFFLFVLISVMIFVIGGMTNENFKKNNPHISDFYTEEERKAFEAKMPVRMAVGIGIIILGLILTTGFEALPDSHLKEALDGSVFLLCVAVGVLVLVYNGIIKDKYDIEKYNGEAEKVDQPDIVGKACGIIMIIAVIFFFLTGFIWNLWRYNWIAFVVGGLLCGVVGIAFGDKKK